jgi:hypothetical protein
MLNLCSDWSFFKEKKNIPAYFEKSLKTFPFSAAQDTFGRPGKQANGLYFNKMHSRSSQTTRQRIRAPSDRDKKGFLGNFKGAYLGVPIKGVLGSSDHRECFHEKVRRIGVLTINCTLAQSVYNTLHLVKMSAS